MTFEAAPHLRAIQRAVASAGRDGKPVLTVTLVRDFSTSVDDLWDAVTNAERIPRWFLPVSGELKLGGRYQLEGNAGGIVTACEAPSRFAVTWEFLEDVSWLEVAVTDDGGGTRLTLTHTSQDSPHYNEYGPGATGVGWELGLVGLAMHVEHPDEPQYDETELMASAEGKAFVATSSLGWAQAAITNGEDSSAAHAAAKRTAAFYTGESPP